MAERDRIGANQDFPHDEPQNLLPRVYSQRAGSCAQFASKPRQAFGKLQVFRIVYCCHLQRL